MKHLEINNGIAVVATHGDRKGEAAILKVGDWVKLRVDQPGPVPYRSLFASMNDRKDPPEIIENDFRIIGTSGPFIEICGLNMQILLKLDPQAEHTDYGPLPTTIVGVGTLEYGSYHEFYLAGYDLTCVFPDAKPPLMEEEKED